MSATPQALADRVCAFFAHNPDEELDSKDLRAKFSAPAAVLEDELGAAIVSGKLRRVGNLWMAGPHLHGGGQTASVPSAKKPAPAVRSAQKTRTRRSPARPLDPLAIDIHDGVVMARGGTTANRENSLGAQFRELFGRLRPQQHVVIPIDYQYSAGGNLTKWRKAHPEQEWSLRKDDTTLTINRHK